MNSFVLDNSVTMRWCFEETATAYSDSVYQKLAEGAEAVVPVIWLYEVISVLAKAQKSKSIASEKAEAFLSELRSSVTIRVDWDGSDRILTDVHKLAVTNRLSGYDAAYLELALRKRMPLASLDEDLKRAAIASGINLVEP